MAALIARHVGNGNWAQAALIALNEAAPWRHSTAHKIHGLQPMLDFRPVITLSPCNNPPVAGEWQDLIAACLS